MPNWLAIGSVAALVTAGAEVQQSWATYNPPPSFDVLEGKIVNNVQISSRDVSELTDKQLRLLRNAVYARYGYNFGRGSELHKYFVAKSWYHRDVRFDERLLTKTDHQNIRVILNVERRCREKKQ